MNFKFLIIVKLALVICFNGSCESKDGYDNSRMPEIPSTSNRSDNFQISPERTPCYGKCPSYKLIIFGDGTVIYDGKGFVETLGVSRDKISQEQIQRLVSPIEKANYFDLKDKFEDADAGCDSIFELEAHLPEKDFVDDRGDVFAQALAEDKIGALAVGENASFAGF